MDQVRVYRILLTNTVALELAARTSTDVSIEFMDAQGRVLIQEQISKLTGTQQRNFDLSDFSRGVYFIRLRSVFYGMSMHRIVLE